MLRSEHDEHPPYRVLTAGRTPQEFLGFHTPNTGVTKHDDVHAVVFANRPTWGVENLGF